MVFQPAIERNEYKYKKWVYFFWCSWSYERQWVASKAYMNPTPSGFIHFARDPLRFIAPWTSEKWNSFLKYNTWNFSFLPQVANCHESIDSTEAVRLLRTKCMGLCRYSACDMYSYTRKRSFVNFKRLKFMGHPNASEQKCVIRCMLHGWFKF